MRSSVSNKRGAASELSHRRIFVARLRRDLERARYIRRVAKPSLRGVHPDLLDEVLANAA